VVVPVGENMAKQDRVPLAPVIDSYEARDRKGKPVVIGSTGYADNATDIRFVVSAIIFRTSGVLFECNYFHQGIHYTLNVESWRFTGNGYERD
jgi:glucan biosynthesis protein